MILPLRHAVAFLTRLPGGAHPAGSEEIAKSVAYFPVVGMLVGIIGASVFTAGTELFGVAIGAVLCLSATAMATGALHEDGLADSMDALAGGWDREQRLEIFKDSRHGTFGVLSLVLVSLLKFSALIELGPTSLGRWRVLGIIVCAHVLSRSAAVLVMALLPPARSDGLAASYQQPADAEVKNFPWATVGFATVFGLVVAGATFQLWAPVVAVAVAVSSACVAAWAMAKIGGSTGDILGTVEQAAECVVLLVAVAVY